MKVCVYCKTRYKRGSGISFHKFPPEPLRSLWVQNMKLVNFVPKESHCLCSKHFTDDCMYKQYSRTNVNKDCVPTIFSDIEIEQTNEGQVIKLEMEKMPQCKPDSISNMPASTCSGHRGMGSTEVPVTMVHVKMEPVLNIERNNNSFNDKTQKRPKTVSEIWDDVKHDHSYEESCATSSTKLKRVQKALENSRAWVKTLSQRVKRLQFSVSRLKTDLRKQKRIDKDCFYLKRFDVK